MKQLFEEVKIGNLKLNNRFVRSATWLALAEESGECTPELIDRTVELARGEVGLIIAGVAYVSSEGQPFPKQLGIECEERIPGLKRLTDTVHEEGGKIAAQIVHGGVFRSHMLPTIETIGPSTMTALDEPAGRPMSIDEITRTTGSFADAARRTVEAGFDAVQIHAAHGFLLSQFLSPFFNQRNDNYGGTIENRSRFLVDVIRAVRATIGPDYPVLLKINASDMVRGGFDVDEMLETIALVEHEGIDAVEISGGTLLGWYKRNPSMFFSPLGAETLYYERAAIRFKERYSLPLMLVGGVRSCDDSRRIIEDGLADYLSLSRPFIREPGLVRRWQSGDVRDAACISCNGCYTPVLSGRSVYCVQKPGYRKRDGKLRFFSGSSRSVNSKRAVHECFENAFSDESRECDLVIVNVTVGHDIKDIVDEINTIAPRAKIAGCTGAGVIGREGPNESMRALAIMAIRGGDGFAVAANAPSNRILDFDVGVSVATQLRDENQNINMVLLYPSMLGGFFNGGATLHRMIHGMESVFGDDVPIFGGVSVDNNRGIADYQFTEEGVFEHRVVAVGFSDPDLELIAQANHGFSVIGEPFEVTKYENSRVYELDGVRAWKQFTERLGLSEMASSMEVVAFGELAEELPHEFHEEYGSRYIIRAGGMFSDPEGSVYLTYPVEHGTKLWLVKRDETEIFAGIEWMTDKLQRKLGNRRPVAVFHSDCSARGRQLFNQIVKEEVIQRLQRPICGDEHLPWLGMYAAGELTPLNGKNLIHTFTSSIYAIVEREA